MHLHYAVLHSAVEHPVPATGGDFGQDSIAAKNKLQSYALSCWFISGDRHSGRVSDKCEHHGEIQDHIERQKIFLHHLIKFDNLYTRPQQFVEAASESAPLLEGSVQLKIK